MEDIHTDTTTARSITTKSVTFTSAPVEHVNIQPDTNVPQITIDMMNIMAHQHTTARNDSSPWSDPHNFPPANDSMIFAMMDRSQIKPRLTRDFLKKQSN